MPKTASKTPIHPTTHPMPEKQQSSGYYRDYVNSLENETAGIEKHCGRLRWLQGQGLLEAKKAIKKEKGKWGAYLKSIKVAYSTAYACMAVAEKYSSDKSLEMTWGEMLAGRFPSFQKAIDTYAGKKPKPKVKLSEPGKSDIVMADTSKPLEKQKGSTIEVSHTQPTKGIAMGDNPHHCRDLLKTVLTGDIKTLWEAALECPDEDKAECKKYISNALANLEHVLKRLDDPTYSGSLVK